MRENALDKYKNTVKTRYCNPYSISKSELNKGNHCRMKPGVSTSSSWGTHCEAFKLF